MSRSLIRRHAASFTAVSLLALCAATPAFAQDEAPVAVPEDDQEIVVTATKRETSLQDVPFSINA
ncbi:MAG: hypothetical protein H7X89_07150, partial [Rhizobiales bacterium]|nr:hypothetical protein [Hyphomicrobiales bacterium]